ncbi:MAG: hypothetical protein CVU41_17200 [Chloroflexi bacterium HGW-Chloroflexi-3]|nr:MAG: hypothetical protein CVU41_17200 [Chloroflexi bacterium HGW-Chloroflexi-3]
MPFTLQKEKIYQKELNCTAQAIQAAVTGLEGKVLKQNPQKTTLEIQFHKTIHGKVLGDRTKMQVDLSEVEGATKVNVTIYPIDAVGRKLMFGARKGVSITVLNWFFAHLEHRLDVSGE